VGKLGLCNIGRKVYRELTHRSKRRIGYWYHWLVTITSQRKEKPSYPSSTSLRPVWFCLNTVNHIDFDSVKDINRVYYRLLPGAKPGATEG